MSSGKSAGAQKTLNYYGTVAGAVCWGPLDWLTAIICNGNYVWQCSSGGPLDLTTGISGDGYIDLTTGILDPTLFIEGGYLRLYVGQSYGNPDPALGGHPAYRDTVVLVAKGIFFGQNSGTAPNLQLIGGRLPRVPTTIVAGADNIKDSDRQINPIAALAEILLDERGASMLEAQLDAPSWLAAAHRCAQDAASIAYSFVSPLFTQQTAVRDLVKALLDPINGYLRWLPNGKLGCFIYEWGVAPGGVLQLDARHFVSGSPAKFVDGDWIDVPTELVVTFTDRAFEFQNNSVTVPNQRAADIRRLDDSQTLNREHVTRKAQAQSQGVEYMRRMGQAPGTGTIVVRGPIVAGLLPGDQIEVDIDPEPGGSGRYQLARIEKITTDRSDQTTLELTLDPLLAAIAYTPPWTSPLPESTFAGAVESAPSIVHALALPLPPQYFGWPPAVGFLVTRAGAASNLAGFHAYFSTDPALPFAELGAQTGFAARCQLVSGVTDSAATLRLQLLDGAAGPEAYLAAATPGGNAAQAADNTLLAVLVALDGSGRVALDGDNEPILEFCSVVDRSAVTSDTHDYTVLRGRCSLIARAWSGSAVAWIVPRANLIPWTHDEFASLLGSPAYFRVASFTGAAVDDTIPLPECDLVFPPVYAADLPAEYTVVLSSETIALTCDSTGAPIAGQLGATGTAKTTVSVFRGGRALTPVAASPTSDQFLVTTPGGSLVNATAAIDTDLQTVHAVTLTADTGSIGILVQIGSALVVAKTFTITSANAGPGLAYQGSYDPAKVYYCTATRVDVVSKVILGVSSYYRAINRAKSGLATWGDPVTSGDWSAPDATFAFVATDLLLAQNVTILKDLVMGDGSTANAGVIRSHGASAFGTGTGFWLGIDGTTPKWRIGDPAGKQISWDGTSLVAQFGSGANAFAASDSGVSIGDPAGAHFVFSNGGTGCQMVVKNGASNVVLLYSASGLSVLDFGNLGSIQHLTSLGVGDVDSAGTYKVAGTQVVGARQAAVGAAGTGYNASATTADFTGTDTIALATFVADRNAISGALNNHGAVLNTIISRLVAHGLIS